MKSRTTNRPKGECPTADLVPIRSCRPLCALVVAFAFVAGTPVLAKDPPLIVLDPSGVPAVLEGLDRNYDAIIEVPLILEQELPDPRTIVPGVAHRTWLVPEVAATELENSNGETTFRSRTWVNVLNAGNSTAEVSCVYINHNGALDLGLGTTEAVASATRGYCTPNGTSFSGWMLVTSNLPVVVSAHDEVRDYDGPFSVGNSRDRDVPVHPIDCNHPEGIEFACQFVAP